MAERLTDDQFIARARKKHGDRYDYSLVRYVDSQSKVTIVCSLHGEFQQMPAKHLFGRGCASCGGRVRLTAERFIQQSRQVHGGRYDYSLVEYVNNRTQVTIICGVHGRFLQQPGAHMGGSGCSRCADRERGLARRATTADFLAAAAGVHGDRYVYADVRYVDSGTKVTIVCTEHGPFDQLPGSHLRGTGCPACGDAERSRKLTSSSEAFIRKARTVHGDTYDYAHVDYMNARDKVTIGCLIHGQFRQAPNGHLNGHGCPACGQEALARLRTDTAQSFVAKARRVHGERYDYSLVEYRHSQDKVTIRCRAHGLFRQSRSSHLAGSGCPACGNAAIAAAKADTTADFVSKARRVHGERYDYSQVDYLRSQVAVVILCHEHGVFRQRPGSHLNGRGCPECGLRSISTARAGSLEHFLDRARAVHGDRFDYAEVAFAGSHITVTILCREHGPYRQTPASHLNGSGCPSCAIDARRIAITGTSDLFITRAQVVHGDTYDYSQVAYRDATTPVAIVCPRHGPYRQLPPVHLNGSGCPRCSTSKGESAVARHLTALGVDYVHQWRDHDCRDVRPLAFDFALIEHRVLIEFDGIQHSRPVRWGSMSHEQADERFEGVQRRDRIKDRWAKANGWTLFRLTDAATAADDLASVLPVSESGLSGDGLRQQRDLP